MPEPLNITVQDAVKAFERAIGENAQLKLVNVALEHQVQRLEDELTKLRENVNGAKEAGPGIREERDQDRQTAGRLEGTRKEDTGGGRTQGKPGG